ncbi:MAG: hypothetical protein ACO1RX_12785 [Candidatus Sericytochromatia bacterium]
MSLRLLLAVSLLLPTLGLSTPVGAAEAPPVPVLFDDLPAGHWAERSLRQLIQTYGLELGYADGSYRGTRTLTRYEAAALLAQVLQALERRQAELSAADAEALTALRAEFEAELASLAEQVESLQDQSDLQAALSQDLREDLDALIAAQELRFFGSLAFRYCGMTTQFLSQPDQIFGSNMTGNTFQLRFHAGLSGRVSPEWDWLVRVLSNGNDSFNLSWYPFGDNAIPRAPLSLDRFVFHYRPLRQSPNLPQLDLAFGRSASFFGESEVLQDEEVSFTGLQQQLVFSDLVPGWTQLSLGLAEQAVFIEGPLIATGMFGAKLASDFQPLEPLQIRLGGSYQHFVGSDRLAAYNLNQGYQGNWSLRNRGAENKDFTSDFRVGDAFARLTWEFHEKWPLELLGDYVHNFGAADQNTGWGFSLKLGRPTQAGDWLFFYEFKRLEQDYQLSLLTDDNVGGTGISNHRFDAAYQIADKTRLSATFHFRNRLDQPALDDALHIFYLTLRQDF